MAKPTHPWNVRPPQGSPTDAHYENSPDTTRKAYALVSLSFNPQGSRFVFEPGDEVQDVLPADVLAAGIANGEISYEKP